jgi:hypothetical protein
MSTVVTADLGILGDWKPVGSITISMYGYIEGTGTMTGAHVTVAHLFTK